VKDAYWIYKNIMEGNKLQKYHYTAGIFASVGLEVIPPITKYL
jgi:hypothetical protein